MTNELNTIDTAYGAARSNLVSYSMGFFLSLILTLIPYELVREHSIGGGVLVYTIIAFALLQLAVQLIFFLHLNTRSNAKWNLIALAFTAIMVTFLVVGTLWIMQNLSENAMSPLRLNNMMDLNHGD